MAAGNWLTKTSPAVRKSIVYASFVLAFVVFLLVRSDKLGSVDRGVGGLWVAIIPLGAFCLFLLVALFSMWRVFRKAEAFRTSQPPSFSVSARARIMANAATPRDIKGQLLGYISFFLAAWMLWPIADRVHRSGSFSTVDLLWTLLATICLILATLVFVLKRGLRASEQRLAELRLQRCSRPIDS